MKVYLIKRAMMGGSELLKTAYANKKVCQLVCQEKAEEWVSYHCMDHTGEKIINGRVIVGDRVYKLDDSSSTDKLKKNAIEKLDKEERAALGL